MVAKSVDDIIEENENAFKHFFNEELLKRMGAALEKTAPSFNKKEFLAILPELKTLEMKPRVQMIRDEMHRQLPQTYPQALKILLKSAEVGKLDGFSLWPYMEFIQTYGFDDVKISLEALKKLTTLFTAEWAVRPFIIDHEKETLQFLKQCAVDKDVSVRRWASEGTRPRLPWGERLQSFVQDPSPALPILEILKFDPELFVRKSVSNHLNDIAKDHPDLVIKILTQWKKEAGTEHAAKIDWIIRHSLRTLIKNGNAKALKLIGVDHGAKVALKDLKLTKKNLKLEERLDFEFKLQSLSAKPQKLVVDYILHFVKANKKTSPKVFKLKNIELPAKGTLNIAKSHHLKKVTTRSYFSGLHFLEIQVNGVILKKIEWKLAV